MRKFFIFFAMFFLLSRYLQRQFGSLHNLVHEIYAPMGSQISSARGGFGMSRRFVKGCKVTVVNCFISCFFLMFNIQIGCFLLKGCLRIILNQGWSNLFELLGLGILLYWLRSKESASFLILC